MKKNFKNDWPEFDYQAFKSTGYLLHRGFQAIGKIKLAASYYEPHWSNVAFSITSRGFSTGLLFYQQIWFSIDIDMLDQQIIVSNTQGARAFVKLESLSVSQLVLAILDSLQKMQLTIPINPKPQEVEQAICFHEDIQIQNYHPEQSRNWWQILLKTWQVLAQYHSKFGGFSPPIGLMWGTFDIRDARYNGVQTPTTGINAGYIRRNAMNEEQVEAGWWPGNDLYPKAAFFSFVHPQPEGIENTKLAKPGHWNSALGEFILDYDDLIQLQNPQAALLNFFEQSYQAGTRLAGWDPKLNVSGKPF